MERWLTMMVLSLCFPMTALSAPLPVINRLVDRVDVVSAKLKRVNVRPEILEPEGRDYLVEVTARFQNSCHVPKDVSEELAFSEIHRPHHIWYLTLIQIWRDGRVCPDDYAPVTRKFEIAGFYSPDGRRPIIRVNGVRAR